MLPYSGENPEAAGSATHTPNGPRLAGQFGTSLPSLNATRAAGLEAIPRQWQIVEQYAAEANKSVTRRNWRLVGPAPIAETEKVARQEVKYAIDKWRYYHTHVGTLLSSISPDTDTNGLIHIQVNGRFAVVGTPDSVVQQTERLFALSGGFGTFLTMAVN